MRMNHDNIKSKERDCGEDVDGKHGGERGIECASYLLTCSSQSSGGGGLSAMVRANKTCLSHSFITLRAFWLSYSGMGVGVTVSISTTVSYSLRRRTQLPITKMSCHSTLKKRQGSRTAVAHGQVLISWRQRDDCVLYSRRAVGWTTPVGDKQRSRGPRAAGVWVGVPGFGVAVVQEHQVHLSLMTRQLEQQRRAHFPRRCLEVFVPTAVHHYLLGPQGTLVRISSLVRVHANGWAA